MVKEASELSGVPFIKALIPAMRAESPKGSESPLKGHTNWESEHINIVGDTNIVYSMGPQLSLL